MKSLSIFLFRLSQSIVWVYNRNYFSPFWELNVWDWGTSRVEFGKTWFLALLSHIEENTIVYLFVFILSRPILQPQGSFSHDFIELSSFPKDPFSKITLTIRTSTYTFWNRHIQCTTLSYVALIVIYGKYFTLCL